MATAAQRIRQARKQRRWSQDRLANELGTNRGTVIQWEKHGVGPGEDYAKALAGLFGGPWEDYLATAPQQQTRQEILAELGSVQEALRDLPRLEAGLRHLESLIERLEDVSLRLEGRPPHSAGGSAHFEPKRW